MEDYNFKFKKMYPYVETSVLKQKEVSIILNMVRAGRLKNHIKFNSYGECKYEEDDKQLVNPYVFINEKFNRLKTNVLVFDIFINDWNPGIYDKLFIFKSNNAKEPTFNIAFCNTETGVCMHQPVIEYAYDTLMQDIMKVLFTMHRSEIFDFYMKKENKHRTENELYPEVMIYPILERYRNAQYGDPDEMKDVI